jgi:hypothetical protein
VTRRGYGLVIGAFVLVCLLVAAIVIAVVHGRSGTTAAGDTSPGTASALTVPISPVSIAPLDPTKRNCVSVPSSCGYPDATNTGIPAGTTLAKSGCIGSTSPGQVIQNVTLSGCGINVTSANVVIRNVKISMSSIDSFAILVRSGASATIDHVDISGLDQMGNGLEYAVDSQTMSPVVISHANFYNCSDCVQGENVTLTSSYIHQMAAPAGAHTDGFQCNSSCGVTITGNTILNQWGQTSAIALFADFGTPRNSTISGNLLAGGDYSINGGGDNATGIVVSNNRFSRAFFHTSGQYGIADYFNTSNNKWTGNIWDDTGLAAAL